MILSNSGAMYWALLIACSVIFFMLIYTKKRYVLHDNREDAYIMVVFLLGILPIWNAVMPKFAFFILDHTSPAYVPGLNAILHVFYLSVACLASGLVLWMLKSLWGSESKNVPRLK